MTAIQTTISALQMERYYLQTQLREKYSPTLVDVSGIHVKVILWQHMPASFVKTLPNFGCLIFNKIAFNNKYNGT